MKEIISKKIGIILISFMLITLYAQTSWAVDNLSLTGFVRSFDNNSRMIRIYVTSESCKGLRDFMVPGDGKSDLDASLINRKLQFLINSATCERGKVYNILLER